MGEPIFLGYDRAALDREHNNREKVANAAEILAWYAGESAAARRALECRLDVAYVTVGLVTVRPAGQGGPEPVWTVPGVNTTTLPARSSV